MGFFARWFGIGKPKQSTGEEKTAKPSKGRKTGGRSGRMAHANDSSAEIQIEEEVVLKSDKVILVVGPAGCGKGQFIKNLSDGKHGKVERALSGGTTSIDACICAYKKEEADDPTRLVLVDTPRINSEDERLNLESMEKIRRWLTDHKVQSISGVLYLHDIRTVRLQDTARPETFIRQLLNMCCDASTKSGADKLSVMSLLTMTHADSIEKSKSSATRKANAENLAKDWEKSLPDFRIASGCSDYKNTADSAWNVLTRLIEARR